MFQIPFFYHRDRKHGFEQRDQQLENYINALPVIEPKTFTQTGTVIAATSSPGTRVYRDRFAYRLDIQVRADQVDTSNITADWYLDGVAQTSGLTLAAGDAYASVEFTPTFISSAQEIYVAITDAGDAVAGPPVIRLYTS